HIGSAGWTLRRRHRPPLGGLERRSWRGAIGGHPASGSERARQLYVVLPEPNPTIRRQGPAHGGDPGAVRIRRRLRRVLGPGPDRRKRQAAGRSVGGALHRAYQRELGVTEATARPVHAGEARVTASSCVKLGYSSWRLRAVRLSWILWPSGVIALQTRFAKAYAWTGKEKQRDELRFGIAKRWPVTRFRASLTDFR